MEIAYKSFSGILKSWEKLFRQAAEFAGELGPKRVRAISHSADDLQGIVTVWYW